MPPQPAGRSGISSDAAPQRFIPFRRRDLVDMLDADGRLPPREQEEFRAFAHLLSAVFHHEFHARLETLKDAYAPFDPDPDTRIVRVHDDEERAAARQQLLAGLRELLDDGNFEPVTDDELRMAFEEESLLELRLDVDESDFEDVLFFRRGETVRQEELTSFFGLRKKTVTFTNYEKVLILVTFKDADQLVDRVPDELPFEPGSTILKLFQDVPRADLEMLFPNARPRMRALDKALIGVPALISGIIVLTTKLVTTLGLLFLLLGFWLGVRDQPVQLDQATLVTLGAGLGSVGGYMTRQLTKFKNRKMEFMQALADNLYFRNLDNDAGVLHHLVDNAEEEETKEALLAWYFLRLAGTALTRAELDDAIEAWFADQHDLRMDFEVDDGVGKLQDLRLVRDVDGQRLEAVAIDRALRRLDERWDQYFTYHEPTTPTAGGVTARP